MSHIFKDLLPCLNRILVKQIEPARVTKSGLLLSSPIEKTMLFDSFALFSIKFFFFKKKKKQRYGEIVKTGPGAYDEEGKLIPVCVKNGDVVLLPNYGGHKVNLKDGDYFIYRDTDILGSFKE